MKLKYYMRGLGIGIILTTLILTLGNRTVSDKEVIKRASALGMVFQDEENDRLNKMLEGNKGTPGLTPALTPAMDLTAAPEPTAAEESGTAGTTAEPGSTTVPEPTTVPEQAVTPEPDQTQEPEATAKPDHTQESEATTGADQTQGTATAKPDGGSENGAAPGEEISFTIERGMSSGQTAEVLKQAGLIQDADDFNQYIMEAGKAGIIKIGKFEVKKGASYDEIIKVITSK